MSDHEPDLDQLLEATNPVDENRLPLAAESPTAQLLYEKITGTPYGGKPSRASRRRWLGPGLAALIAAGGIGGATAYAVANNHVTQRLAVACYAGPSEQSEQVAVNAESDGPVATCTHAWEQGHVGSGPVPLLVACVTPQGVAAVFPSAPGADLCSQLGLPSLPAGATSLNATTTSAPNTTLPAHTLSPTLENAIISQLRATCLTASQAQASLTAILTKAHTGWTVIIPTPFPPGRPCASPGFDEPTRQVILTGIPPLPANG